jgi:hypothetical protein
MSMKAKQHGGARPGAGRKPLKIKKKSVTIPLLPSDIDRFNAYCKANSTSQSKALTKWINRHCESK